MRLFLFAIAGLCAATPLCAEESVDAASDRDANARELLIPMDRIVAKVNDQIVLGAEVYQRIGRAVGDIQDNSPDQETYVRKATELWKKTLRDIVEDRVFQMAADAEGIRVEEHDLDAELAKQIRRKGSKEQLLVEVSQLDMSWEDYRARTRAEMVRRKLILSRLGIGKKQITPSDSMPRDIFVTPDEMRRYYAEHMEDFFLPEEVKSRLIVISFTTTNREGKRAEAESVMRQMNQGADMALLALWYSEEHAADGGLFDWSRRERFPKEVADALFSLAKGEVGPLVETPGSFVIAQCEDRREARQRPLEDDDVQEEIRDLLTSAKVNESLALIKQQLIDEAYIEPADLFENR